MNPCDFLPVRYNYGFVWPIVGNIAYLILKYIGINKVFPLKLYDNNKIR